MSVRKSKSSPLSRQDWTTAALDAIARGGIDAVAVEPLATKLGATKGSFYWHFKNRDALIESALDEWERRGVDAVIEQVEKETNPTDRFKKLFTLSAEMDPDDRAREIALLGKPDHPLALRAVRRVAQRRIDYMVELLEGVGWDSTVALDRAFLMYYLFVGRLLTTLIAPRASDDESRRKYAALIFEALVAAEAPASRGGNSDSDPSHVAQRSVKSQASRRPRKRGKAEVKPKSGAMQVHR
jgi:AcrR family transcriptional regulator